MLGEAKPCHGGAHSYDPRGLKQMGMGFETVSFILFKVSASFCKLKIWTDVAGSNQRLVAAAVKVGYFLLLTLFGRLNVMAEVSSIEWEFINMSEQEEDLIYRMYKLVGDKWALIAGRIPGRKAEEIERFWIMRHGEGFANRRRELN
ncbi:hypothetical protein Golax_022574 [Gossypium laxum]|uniref:Myb-like domain-containing protein n=1 Tax=Gossypium laxum TaxID=34288 RepID=A0A7J9B7H6_9ROSI|nr:hypothetical protein [Gossypium laxum]